MGGVENGNGQAVGNPEMDHSKDSAVWRRMLRKSKLEERERHFRERRDEINRIKKEQKTAYDSLFAKIMASVKGSPEHNELLKKERKLQTASTKFVRDNAFHFTQLRKEAFARMEYNELFGDKPKFDKDPVKNDLRRYNRFQTRAKV